jgi:hypothetical protein
MSHDEPKDECCGIDMDHHPCVGPVELRPGIRLANVTSAYCDYHWQQRLATADWEGVHEQQRTLKRERTG